MNDKNMKTLNEILEEINKEEISTQNSENLMWMLLTTMLLVGFFPANNSKEEYLQGKVDAYEKIIRRMF